VIFSRANLFFGEGNLVAQSPILVVGFDFGDLILKPGRFLLGESDLAFQAAAFLVV
jgi:hypothetical protein